jgi:hypothetical protein
MAGKPIPEPGNLSTNVAWSLHGLAPGTYDFGVRALDSAFNASPLATGTFSVDGEPGTSFCSSDKVGVKCPCGNQGLPERGCDNAQATGGVSLAVLAQTTTPNGATLAGAGFPSMGSPTVIVIRSSSLDPLGAVVFGDGLRCVDTSPLVRLAAASAAGGASTHAFGHDAGPGTFYYQLWYRNAPASFCTSAAFNLSSGRTLAW